jgi:hypothetical protein
VVAGARKQEVVGHRLQQSGARRIGLVVSPHPLGNIQGTFREHSGNIQ